MAAAGRETFIVFDFDWSLINENSDTWVIEKLAPDLVDYMKKLRMDPESGYQGKWTKLMDHLLHKMMCERDVTLDQLNQSLQSIPVFKEMLEAIKFAHKQGAQLAILSDANTYYIDVILKHLNIELFPKIITNTVRFEETNDRKTILRVAPFHSPDEPHGCPRCPINLCKGKELQKWFDLETYKRVIYIGDGRGDFCPSMLLSKDDIIYCRNSWALHECLISANPKPEAQIIAWSTGIDILLSFISLFNGNTNSSE